MSKEIEKKKLLNKFRKYAEKNGYVLNDDGTYVDFLLKGMIEKKKTYGAYTCPCKMGSYDLYLCPCEEHKEIIKKEGNCSCKLFFKKPSDNDITQILILIKKIWDKNTQLRFCQLIQNCFDTSDIYYVENKYLEKKLKECYLDGRKKSR